MNDQLSIYDQALGTRERFVLHQIMGRTSERPVPIAEIVRVSQEHHAEPLKDREIKGAVEHMREIGLPIGASRSRSHGGYYWATTTVELENAARPMLHQGVAMIRGAQKLLGKHRVAEFMGQINWLAESNGTL